MEAFGVIASSLGSASVISAGLLYVIRAEVRKDREQHAADVARLDGRINTHEAGCTQRQKTLDERNESIHVALTDLKRGDEVINQKLDRLLEFRP